MFPDLTHRSLDLERLDTAQQRTPGVHQGRRQHSCHQYINHQLPAAHDPLRPFC